jgi:hypothetical protein
MARLVVLKSAAADFKELRSDFQARHASSSPRTFANSLPI